MKKLSTFMFALVLLASLKVSASAAIMAGPNLIYEEAGWSDTGLQFTALRDITLTGFTFKTQEWEDTIWLSDALTGDKLYSYPVPGGVEIVQADISWALTGGNTYNLYNEKQTNGWWNEYSSFPTENEDIRVLSTINGPNIIYYNWMHFNNISTVPKGDNTVIPEPGVGLLMMLGCTGLLLKKRLG